MPRYFFDYFDSEERGKTLITKALTSMVPTQPFMKPEKPLPNTLST